jgi:antitoxin (DNA-binding transcriptional repressor) of toxin-antitoxin stability system
VVITRHGKPVAELRPAQQPDPKAAQSAHEWLRARRQARRPVAVTAVEVLRQIYEDE